MFIRCVTIVFMYTKACGLAERNILVCIHMIFTCLLTVLLFMYTHIHRWPCGEKHPVGIHVIFTCFLTLL
jgi:hypothetical protein